MTAIQTEAQIVKLPSPLLWVAATTLGYTLGIPLSAALIGGIARPLGVLLAGMVTVLLFGAVIGLLVGICQFAAMPRGLVRFDRWLMATVIGAALGFAIASIVAELLSNAINPTTNIILGGGVIEDSFGAVIGLVMGGAQWFVLRGHLHRARGWMIASILGSLFGAGIAALVLFEFLVEAHDVAVAINPFTGVIWGLFVGVAQGLVFWANGKRLKTLTNI